MATELFFGSASAQISRGRNDLNKVGSNIGWRALEFKLTSGSSANSTTTVNTVAGPTNGLETRASATVYYEWISPPVSVITSPNTIQQQFVGSDTTAFNEFGYSTDISADGSTLIIGAYRWGTNSQGKVYIYSGNNWGTQTAVSASDPGVQDNFGYSVACSQDASVVIVGSPFADGLGSDRGKVYIYSGSNWSNQRILTASDSVNGDVYGEKIACSADASIITISATGASVSGNSGAGKVYVRSGNNLETETILTASVPSPFARFGSSVKISDSGSVILVGTLNEKVYVYSGSSPNWQLTKIITASGAVSADYFGYSLACSSDASTIVVGAYFADGAGTDRGKVYVYSGSNWNIETMITASDTADNDFFGYAVDCSADASTIVVGARLEDGAGTDRGKVYIYSGSNWTSESTLVASDAANGDQFGWAVACSNNASTILVGAPLDDGTGGTDQGKAYLYYNRDNTIASSITFNICANESAAQANATVSVVLESVDTTGSIKSTIIDSSFVTELGTANAKRTWSATPTSTVVSKGERLRARVYFDDAGTMGSGRTATFTFDGTLANIGDSNITLTEDINFMILAGGDKDTGFDNSVGFSALTNVRSFAIDSNGKIYVGGNFNSYKGTTANFIIRLNPDGTKDTGFDNTTGFGSRVRKIAIDANGKIYVGGAFTTYKGVTENRIIRLNPDGTKDTGFDNSTGFNGEVMDIAIDSNGKIYAVGWFTQYKGVSASGIIRLNPDGTKDTGFDNSTGFTSGGTLIVSSLAIDSNGKIYVGGNFNSYKGTSAISIIRLNPDGTKDTGFDNSTGANGSVDAFAIDSNGKIYAGGIFTSYKGVTANYIIRLNPDGSKDTGFDNSTGFDSTVNSIQIDSNGKIYVGGFFISYKGTTANNIIRLNPDGTKDTGFDNTTGFDDSVNVIAIDSNGKIYVGGAFTSYKGITENYIIRLYSEPPGRQTFYLTNTASTVDQSRIELLASTTRGDG